jgi:hypothetical protein
MPFLLISGSILHGKNTNPILKYPVVIKTSKNTKKKLKNIFVYTNKCLKAKKSYCVFHAPKNNVLACILALITSLLKSRDHWPKFQKQQKFYFVYLLLSKV